MTTKKPCRSRELKRAIAAEIESLVKKAAFIENLRWIRGETEDLHITTKSDFGSIEIWFRVNTMNLPSVTPLADLAKQIDANNGQPVLFPDKTQEVNP